MYLTDCAGPPTVIEITSAADRRIFEQRLGAETDEVRLPDRLCRQIERIVRRDERRQPLLQTLRPTAATAAAHRSPIDFAEVMRDGAERAGERENADALGRRLRKARQDFGGVGEFVERFDERDARVRHLRAHHFVVAGERAGVRTRSLLRLRAAARDAS